MCVRERATFTRFIEEITQGFYSRARSLETGCHWPAGLRAFCKIPGRNWGEAWGCWTYTATGVSGCLLSVSNLLPEDGAPLGGE